MVPAASELALTLRALVEAADGAAGQVIPESTVGAASDESAVRKLVEGASALTVEHEHVPYQLLREFQTAGLAVHPSPDALQYAQDKLLMRSRLTQLGIPCPAWAEVADDAAEVPEQLAKLAKLAPDNSVIVKTARGGYDGKGVRVVSEVADFADWIASRSEGGPRLLLEQKVPFTRELAVLIARRASGEMKAWPVVQSTQKNGVCSEVIAPAPHLSASLQKEAEEIAFTVATELNVTGVLAVEMFVVESEEGHQIFVNELAMRPHNCGHWTINGSVTSQFEQHLRAVLDLPLGDTSTTADWTVMVNILGSTRENLADSLPEVLAQFPTAKLNLYGKEIRPGRKLGHVNVSGDDLAEVQATAVAAAELLLR